MYRTHYTPKSAKMDIDRWTDLYASRYSNSDQTLKTAPFFPEKSGLNRNECNSCTARKVKTGLNF